MTSRIVVSGVTVIGSWITPLSNFLTWLNLARLILRRHVLVNDADAAFLRERDREPRLGDGVHGGRDDRDVQREGARELGLELNFARQELGVSGLEEDVVESERLVNDPHRELRREVSAAVYCPERRRVNGPSRLSSAAVYCRRCSSGDSLQLPFEERRILSVSGLNREAQLLIEGKLGVVWVEGEISNLSRPSSGHLYWSLKDANAQVRCAMFRMSNRGLGFELANGQQILVRGACELVRGARRVSADRRVRRGSRRRRAAPPVRGAQAQARGRGPVRRGAQAPATAAAARASASSLRRRARRCATC